MKRIYSFILLFSFVLGVLQPVMPMVEYVVAEGNLALLLHDNDAAECPIEDMKRDKICLASECCDAEDGEQESLLDTDFYPIPLQSGKTSGGNALMVVSEGHALTDEQILAHIYSTMAPPPRV